MSTATKANLGNRVLKSRLIPELAWLIRNAHIVLLISFLPAINLFINFEQPSDFFSSTQTLLYWTVYFGSGVLVINWVKAVKLGYNLLSPIKIANRMAIYLGLLFGCVAVVWSIVFNVKLNAVASTTSNLSSVSFYVQYPEVAFFTGFILALVSTAIVFIAYLFGNTGVRAIIYLVALPVVNTLAINLPGVFGFTAKLVSFSDMAISNTYGDLTKSDNDQLNSILLLLRQGFWPGVNAQKTEGIITLAFLILLAMIVWLPFYSFNRYKTYRSNFFHTNPDYYSVFIVLVLGILAPVSDNAIFNIVYYSVFGIGLGWRYGCTVRNARIIDLRIVAAFMAVFVGYYYHRSFLVALFNAGVILLVSTLTSLVAARESKPSNQGVFTTSLMLIGLLYTQTLVNIVFKLKLSDIELETPILAGLIVWMLIRIYEGKYVKTQRLRPLD